MENTGRYRIPGERWEEFRSAMERLIGRADKLGVGEISYRVTDTEERLIVEDRSGAEGRVRREEPPTYTVRHSEERILGVRTYHHVVVSGEAPRLNGWVLVAVLERIDDPDAAGVIIRLLPGAERMGLERYRDAPAWCDHCELVRRRNDTFVVRHEDGRMAQVGRNCLRDFTGHDSPDDVARYAQILFSIQDLASGTDPEDFAIGFASAPKTLWVRSFLETAVTAVREYGWMSRTRAAELQASGRGAISTADRVMEYIAHSRQSDDRLNSTEEDREIAEAIHEWAIGYFGEMPMSQRNLLNDYEHNLSVVGCARAVSFKQAGLLASLVPFFQRQMALEIEREKRQVEGAASRHFGTVGERGEYALLVLTSDAIESEDSRAGVYTRITFRAAGRDHARWNASGNVTADWRPGQIVLVKATVKGHDVRGGVQVTQLNRVKAIRALTEEPQTADAEQDAPQFTAEQLEQFDQLRQFMGPFTRPLDRVSCDECDVSRELVIPAEAREFIAAHRGHTTAIGWWDKPRNQESAG